MRPKSYTITATNKETPWYPVDRRAGVFNVSITTTVPATTTPGTVTILTTSSRLDAWLKGSASQSGSTVTVVTEAPHLLTTSDYVRISGSGIPTIDGEFKVVSVVTETSFTITAVSSATISPTAVRIVPISAKTNTHTAGTSTQLTTPCTAVRVAADTTTGPIKVEIVQAGKF